MLTVKMPSCLRAALYLCLYAALYVPLLYLSYWSLAPVRTAGPMNFHLPLGMLGLIWFGVFALGNNWLLRFFSPGIGTLCVVCLLSLLFMVTGTINWVFGDYPPGASDTRPDPVHAYVPADISNLLFVLLYCGWFFVPLLRCGRANTAGPITLKSPRAAVGE
ncbi:MAG: hypothetical protein LBQ10_09765 [Desulfovibrio sp.]|jgi:hypothetical protein|nr:hypothetical protein [Desulfovibrio sp.]